MEAPQTVFRCTWAFGLILGLPIPVEADEGYVSGANAAERAAAAVRAIATSTTAKPDYPKDAMPIYAARLQLGQDVQGTLLAIDRMMDAVVRMHDDPFNLHAIVHGYCLQREKFDEARKSKFRNFAARWYYSKPIGVSLNYELMRDGAGWLAAQEWPELEDRGGLKATEIQRLCKARLLKAMSDATLRNNPEYESPEYTGADLMALRMLAEFARDEELQRASQITLEAMLIHTGAHWHHGYLISSAGRSKHWASANTSPDAPGITTAMAYVLFGGDRAANVASVPQTFWLAHPGKAMSLDWLVKWQTGLPETRTVLGAVWHPERKQFVRKAAWFTQGYGVASERTDPSPAGSYQYKESRRTMLKWISDKPGSTFSVLQENRRRPHEPTANVFGYGENPYAQVMQHEGTLIGVWNVPAEYGFHAVDAPFTTEGAILLRKQRDGWVLCHGGSVLFAFRFTGEANWSTVNFKERLELYRSPARHGGWVLETAAVADFAGGGAEAVLDRFGNAVATKTRLSGDAAASPPRVAFTNLTGHKLELDWHPPGEPYTNRCRVDGTVIDYDGYPLLQAPAVSQELNGSLTVAPTDDDRRTLDFGTWQDRRSDGPAR